MISRSTNLLAIAASILFIAPSSKPTEPAPYQIEFHVASVGVETTNASALPKLPLGIPQFFSANEFTNTYHAQWMNRSGCDFLTLPIKIKPGEAIGVDLCDGCHVTNNVARTPIPRDKTGVFLRFESNKNPPPLELKCHFVYNSKDADGAIARKSKYLGEISFTNDVAIIRLPQVTEELMTDRKILGIRAGKKVTYDNRQLFIVFHITPSKLKSE